MLIFGQGTDPILLLILALLFFFLLGNALQKSLRFQIGLGWNSAAFFLNKNNKMSSD